MLKVGLIGFGYWGTRLFRNFSDSADFEVTAVADSSEPARAALSRLMTSGRIAQSATDLIEDEDIDAVAIATPVATHFDFARRAMLAGKHVLVEKPMCATVAQAEQLVELAKQQGVTLMVDHTFLFAGAVQRIAETVRAGDLGRLCYYDSMRVNLGLFQPDVNALWDLAPHDLSIIDHLVDEEPIKIEASGYCHVNQDLPDIVYLTLHYASQMVAHLNLSWMSPVKVRRIAIGGTDKMIVWDDLNNEERVKIFNSGIQLQSEDQRDVIIPGYRIGDIYSPRLSGREALAGVVEHFARVIAGQEPSIMSGERGLRVVRILEASQKVLDANLRTELSAGRFVGTPVGSGSLKR
ncbi:MAG TPA: Gfo/Idh/MocA family oxidoreductase [Candidatus Rubrimentiphilum sp.]|nr:Gfo/Idh/MocA family oxidoreductase [Candidatus Rubrimentiphilum sp.]